MYIYTCGASYGLKFGVGLKVPVQKGPWEIHFLKGTSSSKAEPTLRLLSLLGPSRE